MSDRFPVPDGGSRFSGCAAVVAVVAGLVGLALVAVVLVALARYLNAAG